MPKNSGRPPLLSVRDKSYSLKKSNVKIGSVAVECELHQVGNMTLSRFFNQSGFKFVQPWKKGTLTPKDNRRRVAYALKASKNTTPMFWTDNVIMYLDAVSFIHRRNSCADASAPTARVWRTPGQRLVLTAIGIKGLRGGNICQFVLSIGFSIRAVIVEEYIKMNEEHSSHFIENILHRAPLGRVVARGKDKLLF